MILFTSAGYLGIGQHLRGKALQVGQRGKLQTPLTEGRNELGGHLPGRNPPRLEGGLAHALLDAANK